MACKFDFFQNEDPSYDRETLEHIIALTQYPERSTALQKAFNDVRMARIERQVRFRPEALYIKHTLPTAAQTMPIAAQTPEVSHDLILTGAITDAVDRDARPYYDWDQWPLFKFGNEPDTRLSMDAIAGKAMIAAGYAGVKKLAKPIALPANRVMNLEMYQDLSPADPTIVSTVFTGTRALRTGYQDAELSTTERDLVWQYIQSTTAPSLRWASCVVDFNGASTCQAKLPAWTREPISIIGFRSSFSNALVNWSFEGEDNAAFAPVQFPIWALCAEPNNNHKQFEPLDVPLFIRPRRQPVFNLTNTIDGVVFAPATGFIYALVATP